MTHVVKRVGAGWQGVVTFGVNIIHSVVMSDRFRAQEWCKTTDDILQEHFNKHGPFTIEPPEDRWRQYSDPDEYPEPDDRWLDGYPGT